MAFGAFNPRQTRLLNLTVLADCLIGAMRWAIMISLGRRRFAVEQHNTFHFIERAIDVARLQLNSAAAIDDDVRVQSELSSIQHAVFHAIHWVAHASRVLASVSSRSRTLLASSKHLLRPKLK